MKDNQTKDKLRQIEELMVTMRSENLNERSSFCEILNKIYDFNLTKNELIILREYLNENIRFKQGELTSLQLYSFHKIIEEGPHQVTQIYTDSIIESIFFYSIISSLLDKQPLFDLKYIHLFDDEIKSNILYITDNDIFYGLGSNQFGCCGLGHNNYVKTPQKINQLCGKSVVQIYNGSSFCLALTSENSIYGWGDNSLGQLGIGYSIEDNVFMKPTIIDWSDNTKYILQISCGSAHTLVLTSDGMVYGWGDNYYGQIGCGKDDENVPDIYHLKDLPKIKSIHCSFNQSFALTDNGMVYS